MTTPPNYPPHQVSPKSPGLALLASFLLPGLGSLMNGDVCKAIVISVGFFVAAVFTMMLIGLPFLIGFWVWGMVDAYQGAQKWNGAHGVIS